METAQSSPHISPLSIHFALTSDKETLPPNMLATVGHGVMSIQSYSEQDLNGNVNYLWNFVEDSRKVGG